MNTAPDLSRSDGQHAPCKATRSPSAAGKTGHLDERVLEGYGEFVVIISISRGPPAPFFHRP